MSWYCSMCTARNKEPTVTCYVCLSTRAQITLKSTPPTTTQPLPTIPQPNAIAPAPLSQPVLEDSERRRQRMEAKWKTEAFFQKEAAEQAERKTRELLARETRLREEEEKAQNFLKEERRREEEAKTKQFLKEERQREEEEKTRRFLQAEMQKQEEAKTAQFLQAERRKEEEAKTKRRKEEEEKTEQYLKQKGFYKTNMGKPSTGSSSDRPTMWSHQDPEFSLEIISDTPITVTVDTRCAMGHSVTQGWRKDCSSCVKLFRHSPAIR